MNNKLIAAFIIWLLIVLFTVQLSLSQPYNPSFPYSEFLASFKLNRFWTTFAQFDGVHYLTIITKDYKAAALIQAFFPLYPYSVKIFSLNSLINPIFIGILISLLSLFIGLSFLYKLIKLDYQSSTAFKTIILILASPVSFYFICLYTESLFFLLIILCFYFARINKWWLVGIFAALASTTRLVGIFLMPALIYEYFLQKNQSRNSHSPFQFICALTPMLGLGLYMLYLLKEFQDPLLFLHAQANFGTSREVNKLILIHQVIFRYIKMFMTIPFRERIYFIIAQEFFAALLGLLGSVIGWFHIRKSYLIFTFFAFITPTLTGTFSSMPRYLLPLFPIYILMAKLLPNRIYALLVAISILILIINLVQFTQGLWIS